MSPEVSTLYDKLQHALLDEPTTPIGRRLLLDTDELQAVVGVVRTVQEIANLGEPLGPVTIPAARQCHFIKERAREALAPFIEVS